MKYERTRDLNLIFKTTSNLDELLKINKLLNVQNFEFYFGCNKKLSEFAYLFDEFKEKLSLTINNSIFEDMELFQKITPRIYSLRCEMEIMLNSQFPSLNLEYFSCDGKRVFGLFY